MDEIYNVISYQNLLIYTYYDITDKRYGQLTISKNKNDIEQILSRLGKITNQIGFQNLSKDYYALHCLIDARNIINNLSAMDICERVYNFIQQYQNQIASPIMSNARYMNQLDLCTFFGFQSGNKNITLTDIKIALGIYDVKENNAIWKVDEQQIDNFQEEGKSNVKALIKLYNIAIGQTKEENYANTNLVSARYNLCKEYDVAGLNDTPTVFALRFFSKLHRRNLGIDIDALISESRNNSTTVALSECIPSFAIFKSDIFNRIVTTLYSTVITEKSTFMYNCTYNGISLRFGIGGVHGSVAPEGFKSTNTRMIVDIDISSMYATIATSLRIKPKHTNDAFISSMKEILDYRIKCLAKNDAVSKGKVVILKQVLNYIYGKTKEAGSPFYDPKYSLNVTIASQLFMCKFLELLINNLNNPKLLMVNTDSVTFIMDKNQKDELRNIYLQLREIIPNLRFKIRTYDEIYIKDVNNYIGKTSNKFVAKGIFDYNLDVMKDNSARIIPFAVKRYLFDNEDIDDILEAGTIMDFTFKAKCNDGNLLYNYVEPGGLGIQTVLIQNPTRYFYSKEYKVSGKILHQKNNTSTTITDIYPATLMNSYMQYPPEINYMFYRSAIEDILSDFISQTGVISFNNENF